MESMLTILAWRQSFAVYGACLQLIRGGHGGGKRAHCGCSGAGPRPSPGRRCRIEVRRPGGGGGAAPGGRRAAPGGRGMRGGRGRREEEAGWRQVGGGPPRAGGGGGAAVARILGCAGREVEVGWVGGWWRFCLSRGGEGAVVRRRRRARRRGGEGVAVLGALPR